MALEAKPFQQATIDAAVRAFSEPGGSGRYLVADEVGLGKTVVARGVVERLSEGRRQPLRVFYVCSNLAIGAQNLKRLVSFLPEHEAKRATAKVDRPSLMRTRPPPSHARVHVYSLTPGTALPSHRGRAGEGRVEERAFGVALLDRLAGGRIRGLGPAMRGGAGVRRFYGLIRRYSAEIGSGATGRGLAEPFRWALRTEFGLGRGQRLPDRIRALLGRADAKTLVRAVRGALAVAALDQVRPDLVIFDEFQRFREFLADPGDAGRGDAAAPLDAAALRVLRAIRGEGKKARTPLLLLSATPYTPFRARGDGPAAAGDTADDFFNVVKFLYGGGDGGAGAADRARRLFGVAEEELLKGALFSERVVRARAELTALLTRVLSRTERPRSAGDTAADSPGGEREVRLLPADVAAFRHLRESLDEDDRAWAVGLWQSVPLPMQALGRRYKVWRRAGNVRPPRRVSLTGDMRKRFGTAGTWAHPGLRALLEAMPPRRLALPWTAPSLEWWPVGGAWKARAGDGAIDGKLLVFSRFRAVPLAVSGLLSYTLETSLQGRLQGKRAATYDGAVRQKFLVAAPTRPSLLALFHPSVLLAGIDPAARKLGSLRTVRSSIRAQLRQTVGGIGHPGGSADVRPPSAALAAAGRDRAPREPVGRRQRSLARGGSEARREAEHGVWRAAVVGGPAVGRGGVGSRHGYPRAGLRAALRPRTGRTGSGPRACSPTALEASARTGTPGYGGGALLAGPTFVPGQALVRRGGRGTRAQLLRPDSPRRRRGQPRVGAGRALLVRRIGGRDRLEGSGRRTRGGAPAPGEHRAAARGRTGLGNAAGCDATRRSR